MLHMRFKKSLLTATVVSALALGATPALGAAESEVKAQPSGRAHATDSTDVRRGVLAALKRDLGLSAEQVRRQQALQAKAIKLDQALEASLGEAFAGSTYDARKGALVVMVSDAEQLDEVRAAGAEARLVKHSRVQLNATKEALDAAAGRAKGSSRTDQSNITRQTSLFGMTSWYVDTKANAVHVTVKKGQAKAAATALAKYGDAVAIEESDLAPTPTEFMDGGDTINGSKCSAGFNLRNPLTGQGYLLTAGHCVSTGSTLYGQDGVAFGPVLERWFPGYDDAIARNDSGGYWVQGPWVDTEPPNGQFITIQSYTDAPVGTMVCKSGITTKWTCGRITVKDETVVYDGTYTMRGLTRNDACVEPGDSGGANLSVTDSYAAEGVTSGATLHWDGSRYRCLSAFGETNVSWYFPIADSLAYYGPKYGVSVW